jgi:hypothetical protein
VQGEVEVGGQSLEFPEACQIKWSAPSP